MRMTVVTHIVQHITDVLGASMSLGQLCRYVEQCRGKPLYVHHSSLLGADDSGACIAATDADVILLAPDLDAILLVVTQLHEIGHLLLHMPTKTVDFSYQHFLAAIKKEDMILRHVETQYDDPLEMEAEFFASLAHPLIKYNFTSIEGE